MTSTNDGKPAFTRLQVPADRRPMTGGEQLIVLVASAFFTGVILVEFLDQFSPRKYSVLFFLVFWVPMLVLHELGHALAAKAVGWRVDEISIGFGRELWQFNVGATRIIIKLAPIEGYVLPTPADASGIRWKSSLIYAAGPGAELALLGVLILTFGFDTVFNESAVTGLVALKSLAVVILIGAGFNLLPFRTEGGVSDGLGILLSPLQTRETIEYRLAAADVRTYAQAMDAGDLELTLTIARSVTGRFPDNLLFEVMLVEALSVNERYEDALALLGRTQQRDGLDSAEQRMLWHLRALIEIDRPESDPERIDAALREALELDPRAPDLRITQGMAWILRGRNEEGGNLIAEAFRETEDPPSAARALGYLAVAAQRCGDEDAAARFREGFRHVNRSQVLAAHVDEMLGSVGS